MQSGEGPGASVEAQLLVFQNLRQYGFILPVLIRQEKWHAAANRQRGVLKPFNVLSKRLLQLLLPDSFPFFQNLSLHFDRPLLDPSDAGRTHRRMTQTMQA